MKRLNKTRRIVFLPAVILLSAFFLAAGLAACVPKERDGTPEPGKNYTDGSRAVFVYMCGSSLESKSGAATKNIAEMLSAGLPENVTLVIQTGGAKAWRGYGIPADKSCRYGAARGGLALLAEGESVNMGLASSVSDYLLWGIEKYPAELYSVIFWDHGGGSLGGVCYDELYNNDALTLPELTSAFAAVREKLGRKLDLVGFDACLMASADTANALAPYADYMLASEEIEPSGGWDYAVLVNALATDPGITSAALGKAVCDGYLKKSERSGKGAYATLSLTDLNKMNAVTEAFNALSAAMTDGLNGSAGSYGAVRAAGFAESYGGGTAVEGYSNLADLAGFADGLAGAYAEAAVLKDALKKAAVYSVCGAARSNSGGLSFYYPRHYSEAELSRYLGVCGFPEYRAFLSALYGNVPEVTVTFADNGSVAGDGSFEMRLTAESVKYVLSVEFLLLEFSVDGVMQTVKGLGQDNDIFSPDGLKYNSDFRGTWLALDGHKLSFTPIDDTKDYVMFTAPILLNGVRTNLRFSYIFDESRPEGGYYKVLGVWNGIGAGGVSDKDVIPLAEGDVVTVLYNEINAGDYTSSLQSGQTFTVGADGGVISELPLAEKNYQYVYKVKDIFGGVFYSSTALFEMKYTYEELLENPLPDGEYAAEITAVSDDVDNELVYGR